jgi:hypothetical protein
VVGGRVYRVASDVGQLSGASADENAT